MNKILHNSVLYVNLEQLRRNVRTLLGELEGKELVPVLKGNAYGLGLERIGRELAAFDEIHTLAVAQVSEGAALREAGVEKDILVLGGVPERLLASAAELDLTLPVWRLGVLPQLARLGRERGRPVKVQVKVETGLHRVGLTPGAELSALLGVPLRLEEQEAESLSLVQQEPLMAVAGGAARKKDGETVSGDAGTYFKRSDGILYVLLCDGMGSGPQANRESTLALRLLEQFLQAGVDTEHALVTLSSALALRGEEAGGFTTIDLLQVDLFSGDGVVFKLGAAPTYVRKGGAVRRIVGAALPAGLSADPRTAPDRFPIHLSPGDCVLMVSDGVAGTGEDGWLRERLSKFTGDSPKELAADLIAHSPQGATDDRTALVVRIEKRE